MIASQAVRRPGRRQTRAAEPAIDRRTSSARDRPARSGVAVAAGVLLSLVAASCASGPAGPAEIAIGSEACAHCRMTIVSRQTAAQVVSPGDEPVFFDDIGCLRDYLAQAALRGEAAVYVADHRTAAWIEAGRAVFTRTSVATPMASGILAHADAASRDADPAARGGEPVAPAHILGRAVGEKGAS
jgi:copper chaperone NosL